jgi:putative cell wall-binding protein
VFIASGAAFPDALSGAGVAALRNGPLLLTPSAGLPQVVIDEITRLKPKTAIIFGGTGAVSSKVQSQLSQLTGGVYVPRFSGPDRYTTSAAISQMEFSPLAPPVVYIANGANIPDALSGAPLAGQERGPLLLSTATSIPSSIAAELDRLNPQRIVILGGTGSISDAVARQLGTYTSGGVTRLAGPDRYQTSAAISKASFDAGVPVAYIANGANFPDALSGAPVAGIQGGPVLLTPASALPQAVVDELQRLRPERIVILGGTGSVGSVVQQQLDALG